MDLAVCDGADTRVAALDDFLRVNVCRISLRRNTIAEDGEIGAEIRESNDIRAAKY
jgi:hypothetical protein